MHECFTFQNFEVKADDLEQIEELGRGAYGVVEKMRHVPSGVIMAVKVGALAIRPGLRQSAPGTCTWSSEACAQPRMFLPPEDSRYGQHSGTEEAPDGLGHFHEDGRLLLHRHLLRGPFQRGDRTESLFSA